MRLRTHNELILHNGRIWTFDPEKPFAEAVSIRDGRIAGVGDLSTVKGAVSKNAEMLDIHGRAVYPGFVDTHIHLVAYGLRWGQLNAEGLSSIRELRRSVAQAVRAKKPGEWIEGHGWDQERFTERRYPTRYDLDDLSPDNPVALRRICGHVLVANSLALEIAKINRETRAPEGGEIDRDPSTGEPTGILRENAMGLVLDRIPAPSSGQIMESTRVAMKMAAEKGLTGVHCIIDSPRELQALQSLHTGGELTLRFYVLIPVRMADGLKDLGIETGFGDEMLRVGAVKIEEDGSLGARTASLRQPYEDDPRNSGILTISPEELERIVPELHRSRLQVAIHAIGDRAAEVSLRSISRAQGDGEPGLLRHRLEHASILDKGLIDLMKRLGVLAAVQPRFITSDWWAENRVGRSRSSWIYPFRSMMEGGVTLSGGSDCPVEPLDPVLGIFSAVTRGGSQMQERLSVEQAIQLYTRNAAYAEFAEEQKGVIKEGKLADLVVLERDLTDIAPEEIKDVAVAMTIVGGNVVFQSEGLAG